jgi:sodium-dependent dicarboxylate transporter 2/3/5
LVTFLTELTSNTATANIVLPVLAGVARAIEVNPLALMLPATVSASCAFMLPVATPPNAIVFGSGLVPIGAMVRTGLWLNFIGMGLVLLWCYFVALPLWGVDPGRFPPSWLRSGN